MTTEPPAAPSTPPPPSPEEAKVESSRGPSRLWLPLTLLVGLSVGAIVSLGTPNCINIAFSPGFTSCLSLPSWFRDQLIIHTILSTVSLALLIALVVIYVKMWSQTEARFALGITIVMFALLTQTLIQYPPITGFSLTSRAAGDPFPIYADIFSIVAYAIFLYFSLE